MSLPVEEVLLLIEDHVFKVKKELLCEHSDYFRAMFSGNYVENEKREINIDMVDADSMKIIIKYMEIGLIDLTEFSLSTIEELAVAANFLQITELIKQIEYTLDTQINEVNWLQTMKIAENCSYKKLESLSSAFGLLSFKSIKPEYIPTIERLYWFLSNPYLNTDSELDVFKFGLQWILLQELDADAVLVILCCLDLTSLTIQELKEINALMNDFVNSLAIRIIDCFYALLEKGFELNLATLIKNKHFILETYSERVLIEAQYLVKENKRRMLKLTPTIPMWIVKNTKPEIAPHFMYTYTEKNGFEKWLEVADKHLWGWSVVSWGLTKLVVVCGELGRGTGVFMKDVRVYDTLRREWTHHGVELPPRRHAGLTVIGNSMFIVGGVGGFRIVLDSAICYSLKERSFRKIAKFPDAIQNPAVCSHENQLYAAGHKHIYRYEDLGETDRWVTAIGTEIRNSCMMSHNGYIYCTQNYFSHLYRFKPNVDGNLEMISYFTNPPAAICNLGNKLLVFTRTMCGQSDILAVEEYKGLSPDEKPRVLFSENELETKYNDVAGACTLVIEMPPIDSTVPESHKVHLNRYVTEKQ